MGYYATFCFDFEITAEKVEAAEKALIAFCKTEDGPNWALDQASEKTIASIFNAAWGEAIAEEEAPQPLIALATLCSRGSVLFADMVDKTWREWEEKMLDVLAPFISDGGTVTYKGEDFDCEQEWRFEEGLRCEINYSIYEDGIVKSNTLRLELAEKLLARFLDLPAVRSIPEGGLVEEVEQFLGNAMVTP